MARLAEPAIGAPVRTFPARPRPVVKATDLGSAQVLKHLDLFLVSDAFGDIHPDSRGMGLYDGDTRVLSCSVLRIAGERPVILHSDPGGSWRGVVQATNPEFRKDPGDKMGTDDKILRQTISVGRERTIAEAYRERLDIQNHGPIEFDCDVEVEFDADFADIFEVRGYTRPARGELLPIERAPDGGLVFGYVGLDAVTVRTHVEFDPAPELQPGLDEQTGSVVARWTSPLEPGARRLITWTVHATREPVQAMHSLDPEALDPAHAHAAWLSRNSIIETDHELINQVVRRSLDDLCLLESTDPMGDRFIAAGVPWFTTLFGRDSLITSLQAISFAPRLAAQTLEILAKRQATAVDAWRDSEPGKILHELRTGEMSRTGELPFAPYYGSVDSTPLWLILLGETHDWTADDDLVDRLWPNALAALEWIDRWGDRDGDGFVEYERAAESGLRNQGWKDSSDAIRWLDGTLAETPIALAEVQGYVFDAKRRMAKLARRRGDDSHADRLEGEAAELQKRFAAQFRLPDGSIAMALDRAKRPVDAAGSNAGHALWTGIVQAEHAAAVAAALGTPEMVSGWGLRTYGAGQAGYNPIGYHTGTVWPHDTAIAAAGLRRYGFDDAADTLSGGMLAAAQHFPAFRLPELFCGFDRASTGSPIAYPVACSPQAWAAGAALMLIRTMLGLQADAPNRRLTLDPPLEAVPPLGYGGTERIVAEVVRELDRRGHRVTTFASGDSNVPGELVQTVPQALRPIGFGDDPTAAFDSTVEAVLARQDDFDLIHAHVERWNLELARRARIPVASTFHGRLDQSWARDAFVGDLRGLVAVSRDQARVQPGMDWTIVHNGVTFRPPPRPATHGEDFCFVGRMSPEKGFPDAIEVARLTGRRLMVAAKTPNRQVEIDYHEAVIRPLLDRADVTLLGELDETERDRLVAGSRASLVPSAWPEPFGLVVIEALACGTPVLARRAGAIPEILRDGIDGFVGDDAQQLAFLDDRLDELDRPAIQAAALERFSVGRMVDGYEALYRRLLAG